MTIEYERAFGWFYLYDPSYLSGPALLLFNTLNTQPWNSAAAHGTTLELEHVASGATNLQEAGEIYTKLGDLAYRNHDSWMAINYFEYALGFYQAFSSLELQQLQQENPELGEPDRLALPASFQEGVVHWLNASVFWQMKGVFSSYSCYCKSRDIFKAQYKTYTLQGAAPTVTWFGDVLVEMNVHLACHPEEVVSWMRHFNQPQITPGEKAISLRIKDDIKNRNFGDAASELKAFIQLAGNASQPAERGNVYFQSAISYYEMEQFEESIKHCSRAALEYKTDKHALACVLWLQGLAEYNFHEKWTAAIDDWQKAIDLIKDLGVNGYPRQKSWYRELAPVLERAFQDRLN
jgi:tetratricopeptide (TPR) repeat protein